MLSGCGPQVWCDRFNFDCETVDDLTHESPVDSDGDVWPDEEDCAPDDPTVFPGAEEVCDGVDNNCDGDVDEGTPGVQSWYVDADGDGYGVDGPSIAGCTGPAGYANVAGDCDDGLANVNPGRTEICDNQRDDNCNEDPTECRFATLNSTELAQTHFTSPDVAGGAMGQAIAAQTDVATDRTAIAIGAPDEDIDFVQGGAVHFIQSNNNELVVGSGEMTLRPALYSTTPGDELGTAVDWGADLDGDEVPELVGGAPGASLDTDGGGVVAVMLGIGPTAAADLAPLLDADILLSGASPGDRFGSALIAVDPVEGGAAMLIVGAPGARDETGEALIFSPPFPAAGEAGDARVQVTGTIDGGGLGSAVDAGDLDGDGIPDVILAAPDADGGLVYISFDRDEHGTLDANELGAVLEGASNGDRAGTALAPGGDVDGDGRGDLMVGAPGASNGMGAAYVLLGGQTLHRETGRLNLADADARFDGVVAGGAAGSALSCSGDVDDDGHDDMLVGSPGETGDILDDDASGSAWLIYGGLLGSRTLDTADARFFGTSGIQRFGQSVTIMPSTNGDGTADLFIGAPGGASAAAWLYRSRAE